MSLSNGHAATRTRAVASYVQIIAINDLLKTHLVRESDGICKYKEGWSDERIAEVVGQVTPENVQKLRQRVYGSSLRKAPVTPAKQATADTALKEIARRLKSIEEALGISLK